MHAVRGCYLSATCLVRILQGSPQRSERSAYGRSVRLDDVRAEDKQFVAPSEPFRVDKQREAAFLTEVYWPTVDERKSKTWRG